ncbi:molybdate ABC transporter substrate-binding protein [Rivibacter subsaxonicus]|uniref:Molybdenum ABC transporter molybdate-binding protein n=1 Tax=Rivibacter subsaxonicus TaxID=457575 RepID=A0A4V2FTF2_9BURK|nr:molybdate ABC transporter substrate-binding protein [Rivibacter subsaxonicus]RZT97915.1 molybdenum ABC transporter molybdate-binding protein [Rivibacter subsaxonicus]
MPTFAVAQTPALEVFAAGSLRSALTEVAKAFEQAEPGTGVRLSFGASGLLKDRIAAGERADVFASANMEHPQALATGGAATPVQRFARNALCVLAAPAADVTPQNLVDRMLDPALKLGTSTPSADPSGDYAWQMFERVEQQGRAGAFKTLTTKALQLTGGPTSPPPPAGQNVYGALVAQGQADLFVTYCTNATAALREQPQLKLVQVPETINVSASYGVTTMAGTAPGAGRFVDFLLGPTGQGILARHGFAPR